VAFRTIPDLEIEGSSQMAKLHSFAVTGPVNELKERGVAFRSLTEKMDTTTPQGEFLFHVFGALAQFERSLTQERVRAGLAAAAPNTEAA